MQQKQIGTVRNSINYAIENKLNISKYLTKQIDNKNIELGKLCSSELKTLKAFNAIK